ncbi:hypothetical protein A2Y99_05170 [Candidatus Gottesmanbacteria bacterium RBG_13_37_7]|uniref:Membrane protein 6-pyruvoyl-tetrahydropterin synthase-related domain-containing protein n=1 Tax=Candidatus Gottesmanbacteria bacterium RBG_13_37_7 TaxID=1798369 RepID=A0A1F5YG85_9BACT|nr:MAG: hypothetical protein A2Y99_05170 [Candidatus Gottesmanbacteria bacterium RBG_13_37_7]
MNKFLLFVISIILLSTVLIPLFKPYAVGSADGLAHKFRLVSFEKSLSEGNWRPRWLADQALGYGTPIFMFNYILPYYFLSLIHRIGFNINTTFQIYEAVSLILSFVFMYLLADKLWGKIAGLTAATVYTLAPYHLMGIYLYESLGEMSAFVFPPLILYLIIKIESSRDQDMIKTQNAKLKAKKSEEKKQKIRLNINNIYQKYYINLGYIVLISISWAMFILSHNVSVLMFTPVILMFAYLLLRENISSFFTVIFAFLISLIISAFFWIPAVFLNQQIQYPDLITREMGMRGSYFKSLSTIINVAFTTIKKGNVNYYDFTVGLPILFTLVVCCIYLLIFIICTFFARSKESAGKKKRPNWIIALFSSFGQAGGSSLIPIKSGQGISTYVTQQEKTHNNPKGKSQKGNNFFFSIVHIKKFLIDNNLFISSILITVIVSFYLTNNASNWLWNMKLLNYIVYPYRFLFLATFCGSILAGWISRKSRIFALLIIILAIISGIPYTNNKYTSFPFAEKYFSQIQPLLKAPNTLKSMATTEFLPKWANLNYLKAEDKKLSSGKKLSPKLEGEKMEVKQLKIKSEYLEAELILNKTADITVNTNYFPDWKAYIDGEKSSIAKDVTGRIEIQIPKGYHQLKLVFGKSKTEQIADMISVAGVVVMILYIFYWKKHLA